MPNRHCICPGRLRGTNLVTVKLQAAVEAILESGPTAVGLRDLARREVNEATGSYLEVGVAYVRSAVTNRAHFEVVFRPPQLGRRP